MTGNVEPTEEASYAWIIYTVVSVVSFILLIILLVWLAIRHSKRGKLVIKQGKL